MRAADRVTRTGWIGRGGFSFCNGLAPRLSGGMMGFVNLRVQFPNVPFAEAFF
jgi:hypothetical protein